jgi:hypothetical protein
VNFDTFFSDVIATVFGGAVLTLIFFLLREKAFGLPKLDGAWVYEQKTLQSEYNPYKNLTLRYIAFIGRNGNQVYGSAEKYFEITAEGKTREYVGKSRSRVEISGHVEKRYFSKDLISIHIVETGELRESSTIHVLESIDSNKLMGRFSSSIANQDGTANWTRRSS